ncbi:MAG: cell division protein FtsA [Candidatus Yanofskybacteria bacterium]|nr:cell division protein FtsA [Candidatus Yanofskybacteria bacterium]
MSSSHTIAGIDIGNSLVKTVVAELDRETLNPRILGVGISESHGLRKGVIVDMGEAIRDIEESVRKAETSSGVKIRRAYVSVNGLHIKNQLSRGVIAVSKADNEIAPHDLERVIDAASIVSLPANREIIHILPKNYLVDGQEYVKNPLGMKGVRLEAEVLIIDGLSPYIRNIAKCLNANDIEVVEFVFSPLASSYSVLDKNQKEHGVLNLDLGGGVSTLSFFHEGELAYAATLPLGSRHITNDLAVALRTSMDIAETVKLQHGYACASLVSQKNLVGHGKKDEVDLSDVIGEENFVIPKKNIAKVVDARIGEVFEMVQSEMKKIPHSGMIPAGIVITGGGAKLPGLSYFVKEKLKLPVRIGIRYPFEGMADQVEDPSLSVAAGLVLYGMEKEYSKARQVSSLSLGEYLNPLKKFFSWLKNFSP